MRSLRLPAPPQLPGDGSVRAVTAPCLEHVPQGDAAQPPGPCPQGHQPAGGRRGLAMPGRDGLGRSTARGEGCGVGVALQGWVTVPVTSWGPPWVCWGPGCSHQPNGACGTAAVSPLPPGIFLGLPVLMSKSWQAGSVPRRCRAPRSPASAHSWWGARAACGMLRGCGHGPRLGEAAQPALPTGLLAAGLGWL